mmetsp:Transcript_3050/g.6481  ORF Transcript_3050/g.6481 Transcript_3050/m.6481 type:complete len:219 (+) Transcript_3050:81-737(+)
MRKTHQVWVVGRVRRTFVCAVVSVHGHHTRPSGLPSPPHPRQARGLAWKEAPGQGPRGTASPGSSQSQVQKVQAVPGVARHGRYSGESERNARSRMVQRSLRQEDQVRSVGSPSTDEPGSLGPLQGVGSALQPVRRPLSLLASHGQIQEAEGARSPPPLLETLGSFSRAASSLASQSTSSSPHQTHAKPPQIPQTVISPPTLPHTALAFPLQRLITNT